MSTAVSKEGGATSREFIAGDLNFELNTKNLGAEFVSDTLAKSASEQIASLLPNTNAERLTQTFTDRVRLLLSPSTEQWAQSVSSVAKAPAWLDPNHELHEKVKAQWEEAANTLSFAKCSSQGLFVRQISPQRTFPELEPGSLVISNDQATGGLAYPRPETNESTIAIEVLFPIEYKALSGPPIPATLGLSFWQSKKDHEWRPLDLFIYFGQEGFGRELLAPPY